MATLPKKYQVGKKVFFIFCCYEDKCLDFKRKTYCNAHQYLRKNLKGEVTDHSIADNKYSVKWSEEDPTLTFNHDELSLIPPIESTPIERLKMGLGI
jgi:hypothetical protein